jgi:D-sedoheptulose 7-phosphate isomerase
MTQTVENKLISFFGDYLKGLSSLISDVDQSMLFQASELVKKASLKGRKVILVGKGGSAAMASHVAVDLTKAAGVRAINFNEADLITCLANDYGYENWVSKALEFYADPDDLVILISSSGRSKNLINAASATKEIGCALVTLTGFSGENPLRKKGDINFWVNSSVYNFVEMTHHIWLLSIVDFINRQESVK